MDISTTKKFNWLKCILEKKPGLKTHKQIKNTVLQKALAISVK